MAGRPVFSLGGEQSWFDPSYQLSPLDALTLNYTHDWLYTPQGNNEVLVPTSEYFKAHGSGASPQSADYQFVQCSQSIPPQIPDPDQHSLDDEFSDDDSYKSGSDGSDREAKPDVALECMPWSKAKAFRLIQLSKTPEGNLCRPCISEPVQQPNTTHLPDLIPLVNSVPTNNEIPKHDDSKCTMSRKKGDVFTNGDVSYFLNEKLEQWGERVVHILKGGDEQEAKGILKLFFTACLQHVSETYNGGYSAQVEKVEQVFKECNKVLSCPLMVILKPIPCEVFECYIRLCCEYGRFPLAEDMLFNQIELVYKQKPTVTCIIDFLKCCRLLKRADKIELLISEKLNYWHIQATPEMYLELFQSYYNLGKIDKVQRFMIMNLEVIIPTQGALRCVDAFISFCANCGLPGYARWAFEVWFTNRERYISRDHVEKLKLACKNSIKARNGNIRENILYVISVIKFLKQKIKVSLHPCISLHEIEQFEKSLNLTRLWH
ncbi:hypothetical protein [Parashewanella tropica]|uniref:hypothetical protein n=1 Tax=Parashewanella tropica TaxID=2547970 RepID=UPI00105A04DA|nr:hypothetical protein [Parashewanella tropica]